MKAASMDGRHINVDKATADRAKQFEFEALPHVKVKGKADPIPVFFPRVFM